MYNNEWNFRTPIRGKKGNTKLSKTGIYGILTNIYYAGILEFNDQQKIGLHKPMISIDQFWQIQKILGNKGKQRPIKHEFTYTGLIKCGECGRAIIASNHKKDIKDQGEKIYTHYYCNRDRIKNICNQKKYLSAELLEKQILDEISKIEIHPDIRDMAMEMIQEDFDSESKDNEILYEKGHKELEDIDKQLNNLISLRLREYISEEQFISQKKYIEQEMLLKKEKVKLLENNSQDIKKITIDAFNFVTNIQERFSKGDINTKREIMMALGLNFTLKDKKLFYDQSKWLKPIENGYKEIKSEIERLELRKDSLEARNEAILKIRTLVSG